MKILLYIAIAAFGLVNLASGADAPQPCGPADQLPEELSNNVGSDARCFELRM